MHFIIYPALVLVGVALGYGVRGWEHRQIKNDVSLAVAEYEKLARYIQSIPGKVDDFVKSEIYRIADSLKKHLP